MTFNASELTRIAGEMTDAHVLEGVLRCASDTGDAARLRGVEAEIDRLVAQL